MPSTGRIDYLRTPEGAPGLRIDTGVVEGSEISPYYDPMIAKLIVHGDDREDARRRLARRCASFASAAGRATFPFCTIVASAATPSPTPISTRASSNATRTLVPRRRRHTLSATSPPRRLSRCAAARQARQGIGQTIRIRPGQSQWLAHEPAAPQRFHITATVASTSVAIC
jgi:acetyl/propionyl-CoA carboxylase alpha subunit